MDKLVMHDKIDLPICRDDIEESVTVIIVDENENIQIGFYDYASHEWVFHSTETYADPNDRGYQFKWCYKPDELCYDKDNAILMSDVLGELIS